MKIYIVIGQDGYYSDRFEKPVIAFRTETTANRYISDIPKRRAAALIACKTAETMIPWNEEKWLVAKAALGEFMDDYRLEEAPLVDD